PPKVARSGGGKLGRLLSSLPLSSNRPLRLLRESSVGVKSRRPCHSRRARRDRREAARPAPLRSNSSSNLHRRSSRRRKDAARVRLPSSRPRLRLRERTARRSSEAGPRRNPKSRRKARKNRKKRKRKRNRLRLPRFFDTNLDRKSVV